MVLILAALAGCAGPPASCGPDAPCRVDDGEYLAWLPADWDGRTPLPVLAWFHGHGGRADEGGAVALRELVDPHGFLLVAPQGAADTWNVTNVEGFSASQRDEVAFLDAVLADVADRWPLSPHQRLAAGSSQGASVAEVLACERPDDWTATAAVSGTFWVPQPADCGGGPRPVRHVHGDADTTWPRAGRAIGPARQGDVDEAVAMWRAHDACTEETETFTDGPLTCTRWTDCAGGVVVEDCRHDGGHSRRAGFADRLVDWWKAQRTR